MKLKWQLRFKMSLIYVVLLVQFLPVLPVAHSSFEQVKAGSVLELSKDNRIARKNSGNFSRHYKGNRALGKDSHLPAGAKVRYTGKYVERKNNFGIQVELLSGVDANHIGKLVWIYYRNNEQTIKVTDEKVASGRLIGLADVTDAEDLIQAHESPSEFFNENHDQNIDPAEISEKLEDIQGELLKSGSTAPEVLCTESTCSGEETDGNRAGQAADQVIDLNIAAELSEAVVSPAARDKVLAAGIPSLPLLRALHFYNANKGKRHLQQKYLVVIDLTQASSKKRMYKVDLQTGKVTKFTTSHGRGYSNASGCAHAFGNKPNSYLSAGGGYVTGRLRQFKAENALSLHGIEKGKNNNVYGRGILLHRGSYVDDKRAGRTLGCLTIANKYADEFIDSLQGYGGSDSHGENGSAIYVYPDRDDILNANSYWDVSCKTELDRRGRQPRWVP